MQRRDLLRGVVAALCAAPVWKELVWGRPEERCVRFSVRFEAERPLWQAGPRTFHEFLDPFLWDDDELHRETFQPGASAET